MKKITVVIMLVLITAGAFISVLSVNVLTKEIITRETDFIYEAGIKIVEDGQSIEGHIFYNIPIGIAVWSSNNFIANCTFINCSDEGIVLFGSNNTVENCVFYQCCDGIELQKSSNNTFINCRFIKNTHAGIDAIKDNNNDNLFLCCLFYDSPFGCYFSESINNEFENCTFLDNKIDLKERK